jgi:hypothetical protein
MHVCLFCRYMNVSALLVFTHGVRSLSGLSELRKMENFKAPRDKVVCLLNCCKIINNLIRKVQSKRAASVVSADDFLPLMIFSVIKANAPHLYLHAQYVTLNISGQ